MLNDVLVFLKNSLNAYMSAGDVQTGAQEDQVNFLNGQSIDSLGFQPNSISVLMIRLEQDTALRSPDLYSRNLSDGTVQRIQPEIRLNLFVMFIANYQQYQDALRNLSAVIQYFQNHRVFGHQDSPQLSEAIQQLVVELVTLSFTEQNEIWSTLRLPYHPSALYKVKMVVFQDESPKESPAILSKSIHVS
jgi:hypothetical protein